MFFLLPGGAHAGAARGDLRRWQPCSVFSWQGAVCYSAWLQLRTSEAGSEHLGHPYSVLPTCTHSHRRIKVEGGQMTGGAGFSLRLRETWCPLPMGFICPSQDHKGCAAKHSKLHRLGWKVPDHKHTHTYTHRHMKRNSHCHFHSTSIPIKLTVHPGNL